MSRLSVAAAAAVLAVCFGLGIAVAAAASEQQGTSGAPLPTPPASAQDTSDPPFAIPEDTPLSVPEDTPLSVSEDTPVGVPQDTSVDVGSAWPRDRLLRAGYGAMVDADQGRLYGVLGELLDTARGLPESIDLGLSLRPATAVEVPPAEAAPAPEPPTPQPTEAQPVEHNEWLSVLDWPVVDDVDLAHAYFLAGSFEDAAGLYRLLRDQNPDDKHVLLMLTLCERNCGNAEQTQALLAELGGTSADASEWADWMTEMTKLAKGLKGEKP
ncbi:MAG: hypothetical protein ACYS8L_04475 [Planctomycetota bacterium]|jgi:hypothetical protein